MELAVGDCSPYSAFYSIVFFGFDTVSLAIFSFFFFTSLASTSILDDFFQPYLLKVCCKMLAIFGIMCLKSHVVRRTKRSFGHKRNGLLNSINARK